VPPDPTPSDPGAVAPLGAPAIPSLPIALPKVPRFDVTQPYAPNIGPADVFTRPSAPIAIRNPVSSGGVHTPGSVERVASPPSGYGSPAYPPSLRGAGVEGSVVVTFVVDTAGRAEPTSITVVSTTHPLFAEAVRQWLTRTRYTPAEIDGRPVRQLVQQEVGFTLRQ
jgi:TonB family protein